MQPSSIYSYVNSLAIMIIKPEAKDKALQQPQGGADLQFIRHQPKLQVHGNRASVSHGVPVQLPAYDGTNLYCLMTEATGCKKLAVATRAGSQTRIYETLDWRPTSCRSHRIIQLQKS